MSITGPFPQTRFCGASVTSFNSTAGWQDQSTSMNISLVEDQVGGDVFIPPTTGTPVSFKVESFQYDGIVKTWKEQRSPSGGRTFMVSLGSPSDILSMVQVIIDAYPGGIGAFNNVLNVFGFLEGGGTTFGGARKIENAGVPWYLIAQAIDAIQKGGTPYANGIKYKGNNYVFDIGSLPSTPQFYRMMGNPAVNLMEAIQTVCTDAGYEFILTLKIVKGGPHVISLKTRSLLIPQPLGQIDAFIEGRDDVVSYEKGAENRNEVTCGIVIGGNVEEIVPQVDPGDFSVIHPFWGVQESVPALIPFGTLGNPPIIPSSGVGNAHTAILDASPIADVITVTSDGIPIYPCSVLEMRFALASFEAWSVFIARVRPDVATMVGLSVFPSVFSENTITTDVESLFTQNAETAAFFSDKNADKPEILALHRIYDFVRGTAENFLGKEFLVRLPFFLQYYFEEETNSLIYNQMVNQDGYWPSETTFLGVGPMGLNYQNFNMFSNGTGKFEAFVAFTKNLGNAFAAGLNTLTSVIQNNAIFMKCSVEDKIYFAPTPCVHITLAESLWTVASDPYGGVDDIATVLGISVDDFITMVSNYDGDFPIKLNTMPYAPDQAAICTRSTEQTYGPWAKVGPDGPVRISQSSDLNPWQCGGFATMDIVAQDELADIGVKVQEVETGSITITGAPALTLGDPLVAAGPIVSGIDCNFGDNGVTTTYTMRSENPVFGSFSRQNANRLMRMAQATINIQRQMREFYTRLQGKRNTYAKTGSFMVGRNYSEAIAQQYALDTFYSYNAIDPNTGMVKPSVKKGKPATAVGAAHAHDENENMRTASAGGPAIHRGYSNDPNASGAIPNVSVPRKPGGDSDDEDISEAAGPPKRPITVYDLDPWKDKNDIYWASHGDTFSGFYTRQDSFDATKVRSIGMRGPMVIVGWGYDQAGFPVPNYNLFPTGQPYLIPSGSYTGVPPYPSGQSLPMTGLYQQDMDPTKFVDSYLERSDVWAVGPLDVRWDYLTATWHAPGVLVGTYLQDSGGNDCIKIRGYPDILPVEKYFDGDLASGVSIICGYDYHQNSWPIIAANC